MVNIAVRTSFLHEGQEEVEADTEEEAHPEVNILGKNGHKDDAAHWTKEHRRQFQGDIPGEEPVLLEGTQTQCEDKARVDDDIGHHGDSHEVVDAVEVVPVSDGVYGIACREDGEEDEHDEVNGKASNVSLDGLGSAHFRRRMSCNWGMMHLGAWVLRWRLLLILLILLLWLLICLVLLLLLL